MKKVVVLSVHSPLGRTGEEIFEEHMLYSLRDWGYEVRVLRLGQVPGAWRSLVAGFVEALAGRIERILSLLRPEVVIIQEPLLPLFWSGASRTLWRRYRACGILSRLDFSPEGSLLHQEVLARLKVSAATALSGLVCAHPRIVERVEERCGTKCRVELIPPGFDRLHGRMTELDVKRKAFSDTFEILWVGNVVPHKGLDVLLDALFHLSQQGVRGWHCTIVGSLAVDPSYVLRIQEEISAMGLSRRVDLVGRVDDLSLMDHFERAHTVVLMSNRPEMGLVCGEGLGWGVVPVGSSLLGLREWLPDDVGVWLKPSDARGLYEVLSSWIKRRSGFLDYSLRAYETASSLPSWRKSMDRLRSFLGVVGRTSQ
ncbi:glycosyltransferase family 4 protein [Spirochaeta thermophila]|uniref:glycosyltransferase family 4 protein n=1 Tax=Winmispira thermophila TaxID=154 RepID=UPI0002FD1324|nr:glycosyltransferase [Spirochaeta thermophila]